MCADDKRGWTQESPLLCFGTCLCCAIEALGKFLTGMTGNSHSNFNAFVDKYMDADWRSKQFDGKPYVDHLWKSFRNGLAHGFAIKRGGFERHTSYFQVKPVGGVQQLEVNPDRLLRDFERGIRRLIADLRAAKHTDPAYLRFHKAFQKIFVHGH